MHLLVLPERHVDSFREIGEFPPDEAKRMLDFVADVAAREGLTDYRVVVNVGPSAGQTVFHLHWHIKGGLGVSLIEAIDDELKDAMRARDAERRDTLRLILNALKNSEKELQRPLSARRRSCRCSSASGSGGSRRPRRSAPAAARSRPRPRSASSTILEEFMPEPLSEDEIEEIVDDVIAEVGATSMADLGRVMADVMPQIAGRADGSSVSQIVREKLA